MKSNSFVYTTAIVLTAHFISWIILTPTNFWHWWRKFLDWHHIRQRKRRQKNTLTPSIMYTFRPFELQSCDYKSYTKQTSVGRGINFIPKPRSGHRVAANESELFSFGGRTHSNSLIVFYNKFFPMLHQILNIDHSLLGFNPETDANLFQELLKFNFLTQKWSKVFSAGTAKMPRESVSNALTLKDNCLVVCTIYYTFVWIWSLFLFVSVVWRHRIPIRR